MLPASKTAILSYALVGTFFFIVVNPNDVKFLSGNNVTLTEGLRGEVARFRTIEGRPCNLNHTNKGVSCSNESPSNFCVFENNIAETNCVCYLTPALEDDKRILKFGSERVTLTGIISTHSENTISKHSLLTTCKACISLWLSHFSIPMGDYLIVCEWPTIRGHVYFVYLYH